MLLTSRDLTGAAEGRAGLRVTSVADPALLAGLRADWNALLAAQSELVPTMLPGFLVPWYVHAAPEYQCHALTAWRDGRLVGLAPLARRSIRKLGVSCRVIAYPMRGTTPPFDILAGEPGEDVIAAFLEHLAADRCWDLLWLHNIRAPSPAADLLVAMARNAGFAVERRKAADTFVVPMAGSWDEFLRNRPKKIRNNTWRNWRNCEAIGRTRMIAYPGDITDLDAALGLVASLLPQGWKRLEGVASLDDHFLGRCARALDAERRLGLRFLTIDGLPIAYLFEIHCGAVWHLFHSAFDPSFQRVSAGQLTIAETLKAAHDAGVSAVDFLGDSEYLARWTEQTRLVDEITIIGRSPLSRLKAKAYRRIRAARQARARSQAEARKEAAKQASRGGSAVAP